MWRKLLAPVEGILGGVAQEATPFSTEAIRMLADKERAEQKRVAKSKAEDLPPGAPLRDVSVANPLRYLAETGISRSRGNPDTGVRRSLFSEYMLEYRFAPTILIVLGELLGLRQYIICALRS